MTARKVYIKVIAVFHSDGRLEPHSLIWEDGQKYLVDRVLAVSPAAAMKAGGQGDRYTVEICGQRRYLFFERDPSINGDCLGRWFVEVS